MSKYAVSYNEDGDIGLIVSSNVSNIDEYLANSMARRGITQYIITDTKPSAQSQRVENGIIVDIPVIVPTEAELLEKAKTKAIQRINSACGKKRQNYITDITGQELIYSAKETEAKAYLASDPEPTDLTDYPFIASEIGTTAETAYGVAQVISNLAAAWRVIGSGIESVRVFRNEAVRQATTESEVTAQYEAALADLESY